ncbi:MAG: valine--tRNA ligase [Acidobacteria bacterium]|nr:valine--tRNA ligase [Acidobacteriota bacterium]
MKILPKSYQPSKVESKWYRSWEERAYFAARAGVRPSFAMVFPPPNVTGSLHMGHALNATLHDIVIRWNRMRGFNTLWLPGTDHAGIATQIVVERQLENEGLRRQDLGREKFVERVWEWKRQTGNRISQQLRKLGASCDWSRERFTMDEGLSRAVREVFVRLYEDGLIYRGQYIVNWCPRCETALSDLEVLHQPESGRLYYVRYPVQDSDRFLSVATTRPETMLGDTAVAVHPEDDRYRDLVGKIAILPLLRRPIPVIADSFVDRTFGTGAVKITPAHDPNDFEAGRRHGLAEINVMDGRGRMNQNAGQEFEGLDRFQCRRRVLERLREEGLLIREEDHLYPLGHCQRCATVVEPRLSTQWFVKIQPLAQPALAAVENGRTRFVPEKYGKIYFEWMRNIHDWCISRQLWWGHRIPAWYCDACPRTVVAQEDPEKCPGCGGSMRQDDDVLDTWFSSALWPFSTLGWPERTEDLNTFYPTDLLLTGFDIIFFWVARMMMMGLRFMGDVPFRRVYITGLVRDAQRQKMSKSRGNVIDPLDIAEEYGTDALRFTLAAMAVPGTDIPFSTDRITGYRAFANKIWNAGRFVLMNLPPDMKPVGDEDVRARVRAGQLDDTDLWILSRLNRVVGDVQEALEALRFHEASDLVYHFFWHELCDWYLEFLKARLGRSPAAAETLVFAFDASLRLLHPFVPFITEEVWQQLPHEGESLAIAPFPREQPKWGFPDAERRIGFLMGLIGAIRNVRAEMSLEPGKRFPAALAVGDEEEHVVIQRHQEHLLQLARLSEVQFVERFPAAPFSLKGLHGKTEFALLVGDALDVQAEQERLRKEIVRVRTDLERVRTKLSSREFLEKAPQAVVEENQQREQEGRERLSRLERSLARLME